MTSFDKLVDQVDNAVFNTVSEYLEDVMGEAGHEYNTLLQERVLVSLLKKYRPENVIFVEEEENVPEQVVYAVVKDGLRWVCDVSGATEGELFDDLCEAMDTDSEMLLMENEFNIGDMRINFTLAGEGYSLQKRLTV